MSDSEQQQPEPSPEEKEQEQKINKEIEKLRFFLEDAEESVENEDFEELKTVITKCNAIHDKLSGLITNLQELKLELGKSTSRSIRQWKKNLKSNYGPLVEKKVELQRSLDNRQRQLNEAETEECLKRKHHKEEEYRRMMHEKEKEILEERMKAELRLTEKKMEIERAEKRHTKLPELRITQFKGTPGDWIRFENMFMSQIDKAQISDEEKFGYLLELVGPKVRDRLSNLKPGSIGYKTAWERLQSEYGHAKLVSAAHMDQLINLALVRGTSYEKVRDFYEKLTKNFDALVSLGEGDTLRALVIPTINKLPQVKPDIVRTDDDWEEWDMSQLLKSIQKWLKRNRVDESTREDNPKRREKHFYANTSESNTATPKGQNPKCLYCAGSHWGEACTSYVTIEERKRFFADKKLCFSCGRASHQANQCRSRGCRNCKGKHHTSLCTHDNGSSSNKPQQSDGILNGYTPATEKSLPAIIPVQVRDTILWAFLDTGSGRNFVSNEAAKRLKLAPIRHETQNIVTVNGMRKQSMPMFDVEVKSLDDRVSERIELTGSRMPDFTTINRPSIKELKEKYPHARGKTFYYVESDKYQIDIILSDSVYCKMRTEQVLKGKPEDPIVEETTFGWVIHGGSEYSNSNCMFTKEIDRHCERLYSLDVLGVEDRGDNDSSTVLTEFKENIVVNSEGRYEVQVPWIPGAEVENSNEQPSRRRLVNVERKLGRDSKLEAEYRNIVTDQLEKGVVEKVPSIPSGEKVFYMPHKPVVRETASTTKVRMVFDASAKPHPLANSVNECMHTGPPLQPLLWDILIRARMSPHLLLADLEKAFLQISIKDRDRDAFRFLFNINGREEHLRFTRVPFGAEASPFMLGATLQHHFDLQSEDLRETVTALKEDTYVDNLMKTAVDIEGLKRFKEEATMIMESAKFPVHKWESNVLELDTEANPSKILGYKWDKREDTIEINTEIKGNADKSQVTKREILSQLSSVYDPLGLISPTIVHGKAIYRDACDECKSWNAPVSDDLLKRWNDWTNRLRNAQVPRSIPQGISDITSVHLHVFADASKTACSAVAIAVIEHSSGVVKGLLTSKSRISKRNTTIPRLELISGHMAANLAKNINTALLRWPIKSTTIWMDSMTALYWICNPGKPWKVFVSNRVRKIAEITNDSKIVWKYCPTKMNLADLGSRGSPLNKMEAEKWFEGPDWLLDEEGWPEQPKLETSTIISEECSPAKLNALLTVDREPDEWDVVIEKHPYWKAMRITAWAMRFVNNCRAKNAQGEEIMPLTLEEISDAEERWVKRVQSDVNVELENPGWTIVKDDRGILRCKGRITGYQPIYLEKGVFTDKLIRHVHKEGLHLGIPNTMAAIREKYWIPKLRSKVKKVINDCAKCKTFSTKPYGTTATAALPAFRTESSRPFQTTGVDFAGPLEYKISKEEKGKCYILIFTCATSRAVHLEVTKSQTAEELQQKLTAFITRRTRPELIISDNAQTFKTTAEWIQQIRKSEALQDFLAKQNIRWQFNLAKSPWWGGMYERLIKDVKKTLYKTMGRANLTLEQFESVVMDIERHLNNRPLTYMESEAGEEQVLTPNLIMWGQDAHIIEDIEADLDEVSKIHRRLMEKKQHAWRRWKTEYIHSLMESHRISKGTDRHPEVGEIVLLVGDEKNRGEWKKGKVTRLIRGKDGVIRGVKLLHKGHQLERPLSLICPLEIQAATQSTANDVLPQRQPMQRRITRQAAQQAQQAIKTVLEHEELN